MPSRAFYDLEPAIALIWVVLSVIVLMPSRAFYDLEQGKVTYNALAGASLNALASIL